MDYDFTERDLLMLQRGLYYLSLHHGEDVALLLGKLQVMQLNMINEVLGLD